MIAVDTNILVYAHRKDSAFHDRAVELISQLAEGRAAWMIPWPCVHEFLAIVTHPKIYSPPTPIEKAVEQVDAWLESPSVHAVSELGDYWSVLSETLRGSRVMGPQIHDARVAAICRQHGVRELWTADRDFGRFAGVTVKNPLVG